VGGGTYPLLEPGDCLGAFEWVLAEFVFEFPISYLFDGVALIDFFFYK